MPEEKTTLPDLDQIDFDWIDERAAELMRESERRRGSVRPNVIRREDFRDYFATLATWELARRKLAND